MKAPVFKGVGKSLAIEELPDPAPGSGELVVQVGRCGICGSDLHMTTGHHDLLMPENTVMGHEFAGEVVAIGPDVEGFKIGDQIISLPTTGCGKCEHCLSRAPVWCSQYATVQGGYGQYATVKAHASIQMPRSLSMDDGALCEPLAVALHGVLLANSKPGARVLVIGLGAIGLATVHWTHKSLMRVVATAPSRRAEHLASSMGADGFALLDENLADEAQKYLGGLPDVVYECSGAPGMMDKAIEMVKNKGTVIVLGNCLGPDTFTPWTALRKEVNIQFSVVYNLREVQIAADSLDAGHIEPRMMITDTVGYNELPLAFEALRTPSTQCKVMIDPWKS